VAPAKKLVDSDTGMERLPAIELVIT
jgi:hypothetical protein